MRRFYPKPWRDCAGVNKDQSLRDIPLDRSEFVLWARRIGPYETSAGIIPATGVWEKKETAIR
jgi:hypothetical protein